MIEKIGTVPIFPLPGKLGREFNTNVLIDNNVPSALGISGVDFWGNTPPQPVINQPSRDDNVNGFIHISGVAYDKDFKEYYLEYGAGIVPTNWNLINYSTNAVMGGELGVWDSKSLSSGIYSIRLRATDKSNKTSSDTININLVPPRAYITIEPISYLDKDKIPMVSRGIITVILSNDKPVALTPILYFTIGDSFLEHHVSLSNIPTNNDLWAGTFEITTNTGDGRAMFHFQGEDDFGNVGTEILEGEHFDIDTSKPYARISFSTPPPLNAGSFPITLIVSEFLPNTPELYFIPYNSTNKIYITNWLPGINQYSGNLLITTNLNSGEATFYFKGIDKTGNIGTEIISNEIFFIAIDKVNPIAIIISPVSNEILWGIAKITGTATDDDYFGTTNNFGNYRLEYGEGENPAQWNLIDISPNVVQSNLLAEWDTSDLSGYYTIKLTVVDGTGNSAEDRVLVRLNNVHHFKIIHDGEGYTQVAEPIIISARDIDDNIITNFTGNVTIDTVVGNVNTISWANITGKGSFIDEGVGSDRAIYEFVSLDNGIITLTIIDNIGEMLDIRAKNQQAEDDDTEGLLNIITHKIILISPTNNSFISNIMPTFKWKIPTEESNNNLHFKIEISTNMDFSSSMIYAFESKDKTISFMPVPPVRQGIGNQYYTMLIKLEYNKLYYWKVWAWNGKEYYIDSFIWQFEIRE